MSLNLGIIVPINFNVPIIKLFINALIAGANKITPLRLGIFSYIANLNDVMPPIDNPVKKTGIY